ncbi:hypothetical protein HJC23_001629 [Cyclotella cryptica]|uniref:Chitin-binding type-2 domain-containing protein n=1 Tax=Cyclotella cryptica TaxID=29204 RepID=A0ABD3QKR0_9STRA
MALARGDSDCPPGVEGWVPSVDCKQYHLCEGGSRTTPDYNCRDGFLFDVSTTNCEQESSVKCKAVAAQEESLNAPAEESTGEASANSSPEVQTGNSGQPSCDGIPDVYFMYVPDQTCYSICQMEKPEWVQEIFPTRENCCEVNFPWMDVAECTGVEFKGEDYANAPKMWTVAPTIAVPTSQPITNSTSEAMASTPTAPPIKLTQDDPRFFYICGVTWADASTKCQTRCSSGEDDECPSGEMCFSEANCPNGVVSDTSAPTMPLTPAPIVAPDTPSPILAPGTTAPKLAPDTQASLIGPETAATSLRPAAPAPSLRPTPRTRKPRTPRPTSASTVNPDTPQPSLGVVTETPSTITNDSMEAMSAVYPSAGSSLRPVATSHAATLSPVVATRKPRPESVAPVVANSFPFDITARTPSTASPTFVPTPVPTYSASSQSPSVYESRPPNFVVTMVANPTTTSMETMMESAQASKFNEAYGYGMVPQMATFDQPENQSYISLYSQEYDQASLSAATQAPLMQSAEEFFTSFTTTITELIIPVSADATVSPERPDLNFGTNSMLALDGDNTAEQFDILLKFDVSLVDQDSTIKSASLKMYALEDCPVGGIFYSTTSFNSNWASSSVTWNTAPGSVDLLDSLGAVFSDQWYSVDVTPLFNTKSLSDVVTIRVDSTTAGRCMYASMENQSGNAPNIVLEVEQKPQTQIVGMSGSLNDDPPMNINLARPMMPIVAGEFAMVRASSDATVDAVRVNEKLGTLPSLHISVSRNPRQIFDSLICFNLAEFQKQLPKSAMLVLFSEQRCLSAGKIAATGMSETWSETDMTWTYAPYSEFDVGTFGAIEAGHWYAFNVLEALEWAYHSGKAAITFRLSSDGDHSCQYSSIQSGRAPKLIASF